MRLENTWQEIRDHSFIRITPDPSDSQLHDGASSLSVHLTHFLQGSGQRTGMAIAEAWFCAQWPIFVVFEVCFWIIIRLEDPNMVHYKISNRVSHLLIFYLLVFDRIHDAMCPKQDVLDLQQKYSPQHKKCSSIFHCTHGVLFIPVFTKPILSVCCLKSSFLVSSDHRSQSHLKFQSCLITEYAWRLFLDEWGEFFLKPSQTTWWCRGCLAIFFKAFWPRDSIIFCNSPAVVLEESLTTQTLLLTVH